MKVWMILKTLWEKLFLVENLVTKSSEAKLGRYQMLRNGYQKLVTEKICSMFSRMWRKHY